jgi:hypothetical protein
LNHKGRQGTKDGAMWDGARDGSVDDAGATDVARHFYRALASADVPGALARAQRAMLAYLRMRDPYFWAAYDVMGAGTLYPGSNGTR